MPGIERLTTWATAFALCVQSVAAIPASCHCSDAASAVNVVAACCHATTVTETSSCCSSQRSCCGIGECGCGANGTSKSGCGCGCGENDNAPYKTNEKIESGRDIIQQCDTTEQFAGKLASYSPVVKHIESSHTAHTGLPSAQILFCIWQT